MAESMSCAFTTPGTVRWLHGHQPLTLWWCRGAPPGHTKGAQDPRLDRPGPPASELMYSLPWPPRRKSGAGGGGSPWGRALGLPRGRALPALAFVCTRVTERPV